MSSHIMARRPRAVRMRCYRHALWLMALLTGVAGGVAPGQRASAVVSAGHGPAIHAGAISAAVAHAAGDPAAAAATCKPVWFIGARGSGEKSLASEKGMGKEVYYMASQVSSAFKAKGVAVAFMPVDYPADSVNDLKPNSTVLADLRQRATAAAFTEYKKTSVDKYDASMTQGIKQVEADVAAVVSSCPGARIILGGYSQGAVAVHDAENWLVNNKPAEFKQIAGTLLLGDPERVPNTKARRYGDSAAKAEGLRVYLHLVLAHDVPAPASTANIANTGDMVGDFQGVPSLKNAKADTAVHSSYQTTVSGRKLLAAATAWVAGQVRPVITTAKLPAATVGQHYSVQLTTSDHRTGTWKISSGTLPAGLTLSGSTISGTPTTVGKFAFSLSFIDTSGLTATAAVMLDVSSLLPADTWEVASLTLPAGATTSQLSLTGGGQSCSALGCAFGGWYDDSSGHRQGILGSWPGAGRSWTVASAPLPSSAATNTNALVRALSCGANICAASGFYTDSSGGVQGALWTWTGGDWHVTEAPLPADVASDPDVTVYGASGVNTNGCGQNACSVACGSDSCVALGTAHDASGVAEPVLWTWSNGGWAGVFAPELGGEPSAAFPDIASCSAGACTAVGWFTDSSKNNHGVIWQEPAGTWTATAAPAPPGATSLEGFGQFSCGPAACIASAWYLDSNNVDIGTFVVGAGSAWTADVAPTPLPLESGTGVGIEGVACRAAECIAAGEYHAATGFGDYALWTWSGGSWSVQSAPYPGDARQGCGTKASCGGSAMSPASCGTSTCIASFDYANATGYVRGSMVTWSNGSWSSGELGIPADIGTNEWADRSSCGGTVCAAVGDYLRSSSVDAALLASYANGTWTTEVAPLPQDASANGGSLSQPVTVTCGGSQCFAEGIYYAGSSDAHLVIWSRWSDRS